MRLESTSLPVFLLLYILALAACSPERKLAGTFRRDMPPINIQLIIPDQIYKYDHKGELIADFDNLSETQQDSALFSNSRYIQYISDSIYLDHYVNSFVDHLRSMGFKVFLESSIDSFLMAQPQCYILNMAQIQLDEYIMPYEDSEPFDDTVYYKRFDLNAVDASVWFELSKVNTQKPVKTVLYSSFTASDGLNGHFMIDPLNLGVRYKYKLDSLKVKDIYDLAGYTGRQNAEYLYDYFLNQYIAYHLPEGVEPEDYFHYLPDRHTFVTADEDRFDILQSN